MALNYTCDRCGRIIGSTSDSSFADLTVLEGDMTLIALDDVCPECRSEIRDVISRLVASKPCKAADLPKPPAPTHPSAKENDEEPTPSPAPAIDFQESVVNMFPLPTPRRSE